MREVLRQLLGLLRGTRRERGLLSRLCCKYKIRCVILRNTVPVLLSSTPSFWIGQSAFSAPLYFRTFFQSVFESMEEGSPETTIVRIARGSLGPEGCVGFGALEGLDSFLASPESFSCLSL